MTTIVADIGVPATLEQLAEECAELSKAALKLSRIIRNQNPTPVTYETALANLTEEATDVHDVLALLGTAGFIVYNPEQTAEKIQRWGKRIDDMSETPSLPVE